MFKDGCEDCGREGVVGKDLIRHHIQYPTVVDSRETTVLLCWSCHAKRHFGEANFWTPRYPERPHELADGEPVESKVLRKVCYLVTQFENTRQEEPQHLRVR